MHLKQLKLAGFKSFVDPTTVPFPSQLVAVVGPNGCGKSNIIDAVRWVMGESSAKNLRGESMTDVIFNGSSNRKAVGQASVELVFDNRLGRLTGQYASYQEIAVKRLVTRDGDSHYFLNGTRCRRRDITDIFLGTGAGARGYSIIGQGTISRLVEARPEELRGFLEEAAGVSKYKERRRETLMRIQHTRENLLRVADIREELGKQLQRLERQAKAAERYQELKEEERQTKADILSLKWQQLDQEQVRLNQIIQEQGLVYEKHQAGAAHAWQQSITVREQIEEANTRYQALQSHFYQVGTDIARLEEGIEQQRREKQRLQTLQEQIHKDWQSVSAQQQQDADAIQVCEINQAKALQDLQVLSVELAEKEALLQQKQQEQQAWQVHFEQLQQCLHQASSEKQMAQWRLDNSQQGIQETQARLQAIVEEQARLEIRLLEAELLGFREQSALLQAQLIAQEQEHQAQIQSSSVLAEALKDIERTIRKEQDKGYQLNTRLAAVTALLQTARDNQTRPGSQSGPWKDKPRLVERIQAEPEWQAVCEMVLGQGLQAIVVDSITSLLDDLPALAQSQAMFVTAHPAIVKTDDLPRLIDKIEGIKPHFLHGLDKIIAADSLEEAIHWLANLPADESIVTRDGYWLSTGWLKVPQEQAGEKPGLLASQQELLALRKASEEAEQQLARWISLRDERHLEAAAHEKQVLASQQQCTVTRDALQALMGDIKASERQLLQASTRELQLSEEKEKALLKLESLTAQQLETETLLSSAKAAYERYDGEQRQWLAAKASWQDNLAGCQREVEDGRNRLRQTDLQAQREGLKLNQLQEGLHRGQERLQILQERLEEVRGQLLALDHPDSQLQSHLQEKIGQHLELETLLTAQKEQMAALNRVLDELSQGIKTEEKQAKDIQAIIQQGQMDEQALKVRASGLIDTLTELGCLLDDVLKAIPAEMTLASREQYLLDLVNKINRLGAINLAAIEEYNLELQRKQHLDEQYDDLNEALATLDAAIEKMDKETRQRFQMTFDEVNAAFQSLFPRLFGGGRAMLELTCDNLLEAGVLVMAQPPGKRNSTIHLLSGGEKAMTAVALVFAIFQLNPSPFCMLDEVDAPLDDVNVGRFCTLVKEMSQFVQFLFITHNKVTMELAEHLIGVTMREPGVSRVVAVDVEQALSMTES